VTPTPLGARLGFIASLISTTGDLWDIGCDHGLLLELAVNEKRNSQIVGVDRSIQVIRRLRENPILKNHPQVQLVCNVGQQLDWDKIIGNVVIAGMGWPNIKKILTRAQTAKHQSRNWILSPHADHEVVMRELEIFRDLATWKTSSIQDRGQDYLILHGTP
jgi:tRNA A22 N-methylase